MKQPKQTEPPADDDAAQRAAEEKRLNEEAAQKSEAASAAREIARMDVMLNGTVLSGHASGRWVPQPHDEDARVGLPDGDYQRTGSTWRFTVKDGRIVEAVRADMAPVVELAQAAAEGTIIQPT